MFSGFSKETFEFFMAIKFNNNREFFIENHDWYVNAVRDPARELAEALSESVRALDPALETRPHKVVSRINRDVRFSADKSPYRDYLWIAFRRPGVERATTLGVYFDIGVSGASYGMGYYDENREMMNALRRQILRAPEHFQGIAEQTLEQFTLHPKTFKRMTIPDGIPEPLRQWYNLKGFYVEKELSDVSFLCSPALVDEIRAGYARLKPMYDYMMSLMPEPDGQQGYDGEESADNRAAKPMGAAGAEAPA